MSLWGCDCPLLALAACHRRGIVCSRLSLFSPLFRARAWQCLRLGLAFRMVGIPQSGLLAQIISLRKHSGYSGQIFSLSDAARAAPPCPHCSGSRLLHRETSAASPGLLAPPRSKLLRFRHLGSPQRHRLGWACVLCPSQVRAAQVMRCLASAIAVTYRLPTAGLSRCTTGAPSQVDVDCPDPQEVLVSKEACLRFCR